MKESDIAIVICTYRRAALLERMLASLEASDVPDNLSWEVVVVDNNSPDHTREVVSSFAERLPIRYLFEQQQGKTHALNLALKDVHAKNIVFADDDVRCAPGWINGFAAALAGRTDCDWFGGRVKPDWNCAPPRWFRAETAPALAGYFGDYDLGVEPRSYGAQDKLPLGASLAIRRSVFDRVGGFRADLGPRGRIRGVGDETELLQRAIDTGCRGAYVPEALVYHHVGEERLRLTGFLNYGYGKGLNQYRMGTDNARPGFLSVALNQFLRGLWQLARGHGDRFRVCLVNVGIELGRRAGSRRVAKTIGR